VLGVYLVGKSGQALIDYYYKAAIVQQATRRSDAKETLPLIEERTEDMIKCKEVALLRK